MAEASIDIKVDTSDLLEVMTEITELIRRLGDSAPSNVLHRIPRIGERAGGFYELRTETGADGQITIRVIPGHELLSIWATLMAHAPK